MSSTAPVSRSSRFSLAKLRSDMRQTAPIMVTYFMRFLLSCAEDVVGRPVFVADGVAVPHRTSEAFQHRLALQFGARDRALVQAGDLDARGRCPGVDVGGLDRGRGAVLNDAVLHANSSWLIIVSRRQAAWSRTSAIRLADRPAVVR